MKGKLEANLWKILLYNISQRRQFVPIMAIFFLSLPDTTAQQIGIYSGAGALVAFLFEIPTGYFSDSFGHKATLIISKLCMIVASLALIFARALPEFILASAFISLGFAFQSGTSSAITHDTLHSLKREKEYGKISSQISANASFVSMLFIIALPFLTPIDIRLPFWIVLGLDIIGLLVVLTITTPPSEKHHQQHAHQSIFQLVKQFNNPRLLAFSLFTGAIAGFFLAGNAFREAFLQSLGFPIIFIGFVMGLSRLIWFVVGHKTEWLEKFSLEKIMAAEIVIFPLFFILVTWISNPYLAGIFFVIVMGYFWGRGQLLENYFIKNYIKKPRYKATLLSIDSQISSLIQAGAAFGVGFFMQQSYRAGFIAMGVALFVILLFLYPKIFPKKITKKK
ncbi:MAG: MFS transporter [Candidatus Iainarchaeum archaeon]|uniref:MFS transporter n=1 Tax=Candidatus Iainarchaeum sp. TaxID=3101447 RepID=A0A7T9I1W8_9ARCH|nr:MAG: MFS transporter [Candidatus Diapherotrites archaeon]